MPDMRRDFATREELIAYLHQEFPQSVAIDEHVSPMRGGRIEAEKRLKSAKVGAEYTRTRNFMDGAVTRLSPYIRYGVLSLAEVKDYALRQTQNRDDVEKFINELGWRDYWQRLYAELDDQIWHDQEDYKTGFVRQQYQDDLPNDIRDGTTGVRFIDDFVRELRETGYLHNHARMWIAGYVVHWRRIKWQAGARWFLEHLLDGDPASNNLSWQWVASTFSAKPYYYNLENVVKFTGDKYKGRASDFGHEAFDGTYDEIAVRLFPNVDLRDERDPKPQKRR
jgi:deoxyribodipyrimidine photo-lyase